MKELNLTQGSVPEIVTCNLRSFSDCQCASGTLWRGRPFCGGQYDDSASVAAVASAVR